MYYKKKGVEMHKNKPSKHKPVLIKKRNPVVAALLTNPKRNAGKHKQQSRTDLTVLDKADKE